MAYLGSRRLSRRFKIRNEILESDRFDQSIAQTSAFPPA
jgi:hypothetical protein